MTLARPHGDPLGSARFAVRHRTVPCQLASCSSRTTRLSWGIFRRQVEEDGHEVLVSSDGDRALQILKAEDPDVMVMDVNLPGLSGMDLLRAAREEAPSTEVVVMTAYASVEMAIECLRAGAVDLLRKPFGADGLSRAIAAALVRQQEHATRGLLQASEAVLAASDPDRLPEVIVRTVTEVMKCTASLLLPGADGKLYVAHAFGMPPEVQAEAAVVLGEKVAGRVAVERKPLLLQDLASDPRFAGLAPSRQVRSSIVWPLAVGERLLGVLALNRGEGERRFRRADLHRAAMLASLVQLALENAQLARQTVASERLASLGTIASSITHGINNPLTYVLGNLERSQQMLRGVTDPTAQEVQDLLSDAVEGAERIGSIVRDMRTISRSGQGTGEQEAVFELGDAVRSALRLSGAVLRSCAEVELQLAEGTRVRGSAGQLSQVFVNLLVNAAHAIREGQAGGGCVTVSTRVEGERVVAEVTDDGKGIDERDRGRLFEPFFTTRGATSGTGLGLSISRELLRRHKGTIEAVRGEERGAVFRVTLPLESPAPPMAVAQAPVADKPRVLFVDDEEPILRVYRRFFDGLYQVELAAGGRRAWELLQGGATYDVVVCDLMMPDLNGMTLYQRVIDTLPELTRSFVFVTGSTYHPEVSSFIAGCGRPVLEKPTGMAELRGAIERVLAEAKAAA
ncbi:MAG: response regulator [Myxococcales bacterium]